jgi:hypothetical protein
VTRASALGELDTLLEGVDVLRRPAEIDRSVRPIGDVNEGMLGVEDRDGGRSSLLGAPRDTGEVESLIGGAVHARLTGC